MIGILFESHEWSVFKLNKELNNLGIETLLIDLEQDNFEDIYKCDLVVNRIFASSNFRNHFKSLQRIPQIIDKLKTLNIPMINSYDAHFYEVSKSKATEKLEDYGIKVPIVYGVGNPNEWINKYCLQYPCVLKPDCGGRTNQTYIVHNEEELIKYMSKAPDITFIGEEFINPSFGYLTRIEVIDDECKLILKRSVTENGLSAYKLGSTYSLYNDCNKKIKDIAIKAMSILEIGAGSLDIIETEDNFYIIDVNSVSNTSEECTEMFKFDQMLETAKYIAKEYSLLNSKM